MYGRNSITRGTRGDVNVDSGGCAVMIASGRNRNAGPAFCGLGGGFEHRMQGELAILHHFEIARPILFPARLYLHVVRTC